MCCCSPTSLLFVQELFIIFIATRGQPCADAGILAPGHDTACCYCSLPTVSYVFTYSVEALHVWHLQLIWKQRKCILYYSNLWLDYWKDSSGTKSNLLFLATSWITQERSDPLKRSSMVVWHVNVGVCTSYQVVGHTASSELLLHSLLGTSLSSLSPCPPRSHLLLCSVLKETEKRKGFIGQVSSLNEPVFVTTKIQNLQNFSTNRQRNTKRWNTETHTHTHTKH